MLRIDSRINLKTLSRCSIIPRDFDEISTRSYSRHLSTLVYLKIYKESPDYGEKNRHDGF